MLKKTSLMVVLLVSLCFSLGCGGGGGGGGGGLVSQITGVGEAEEVGSQTSDIPATFTTPVPVKPIPIPTINLSETYGTQPFGVIKIYEPHDYYSNNIGINDLNVVGLEVKYPDTTNFRNFQVVGEIKESGQIDISWLYKRPEEVSEIKVDLTGDIGTSLMELKYVGSSENEVLKRFVISGGVTEKTKRLHHYETISGVWKVVLSVKGRSGKKINLLISKNPDDTFVSSNRVIDTFKEIYGNQNFIEKTGDLGASNKYSVAKSINLTLQRFGCESTKDNIEIVLSYILDARQKYREYPILDKNTHIIVFNGTSAPDHRENVSYCQSLGLTDIEFIDGPVDLDSKAKFLDAIIKSRGKTSILIHSHGSLSNFEVKKIDDPIKMDPYDFARSFTRYDDLANALIERAKKCDSRLNDISISYESCYSADFAEKMLNCLSTGYNGGEIKSLPLVITSANRMEASWPIGFYPSVFYLKNPTVLTVGDMMIAEEKTFFPNDHAFFAPEDLEKFNELKRKLNVSKQGNGLSKDIPIIDLNKILRPVVTGR